MENVCDLVYKLKHFSPDKIEQLIDQAYMDFHMHPPSQRTLMNWGEVSEMGRDGIAFGAHGLHHNILTVLDQTGKRREIIGSFDFLKTNRVKFSPFFSYPNGNWDDESLSIISESGYLGAVTTRLGNNNSQTSPFLLRRVGIHEDIANSPPLFWYRLFQAALVGS
jgi:peptidoglycan/xylan/chitin deacetylase (PgdA/CDA1 family)